MIPVSMIIALFVCHWFGDFLFQTEYMSENKSHNSTLLVKHCILYALPFIIFGWKFALLAALFHFPIDYVSSKITHLLYDLKQFKWFFTVIGFDQMFHMIILVTTLNFLTK